MTLALNDSNARSASSARGKHDYATCNVSGLKENRVTIPTDPKARKNAPLFSGVLRYFPDALLEVAECSRIGNEQHNPGEPLHWAKEKSADEGDALCRHQLQIGTRDTDGIRHATKVAWRALAQLQREIENTPAAPPAPTELAVGVRVAVRRFYGEKGTIEAHDKDDERLPWKVRFDDGEDDWFTTDELEIVSHSAG